MDCYHYLLILVAAYFRNSMLYSLVDKRDEEKNKLVRNETESVIMSFYDAKNALFYHAHSLKDLYKNLASSLKLYISVNYLLSVIYQKTTIYIHDSAVTALYKK